MKVLVSGGAGFIGSHLCERLILNGHEVVCIDNLLTGNRKNIEHLKKLVFVEQNITDPLTLEEDFDQIYHLASPASPVDYRDLPIETLWTNAAGTKNLLDLARKNGASFLFTSTSEVYGDPQEHPQKETYLGNVNPIGERSCYDEGKRFAESLCTNYKNKYEFPLKIVRIFNTYGPRMRKNDGRVIPEFISRALSNEPLQINGTGKQTRSFCYVDDLVDGLIAIMNISESLDSPINLGNPDEITIAELAKKILNLVESSSEISHTHKSEDDPMHRCPDISLAKSKIQFSPKIDLVEGLSKTINYFQSK